jgi:hypothetical protein
LLVLLGAEPVRPVILRVCSRNDPVGGCQDRMEAQARGDFYPDYDAWGWASTESPLRYMSDTAFEEVYIHRHEYHHQNFTGTSYTYTVCPWCFQDLPSLGLVRKYRETALGSSRT